MPEDLIKQLIEELQESKKREGEQIRELTEGLVKINKLLIGNGEIGLCERVRRIQGNIKPLWTLVGIIGAALLTGVVAIILRGG